MFRGSVSKNTVSMSGAMSIFARPIWNSNSKSATARSPRRMKPAPLDLQ